MIPILYPETEKEFKNNGLGGLSDTLSCKVTEERNGSYELELTYPISGQHYSDIKCQEYIYAVPADGEDPQPFEIYNITRPINGRVTIKARHISYQLSYIITLPGDEQKTAEAALQSLKTNAITDCPFSFNSDVVTNSTFQNDTPQSIRALLGGQSGSIIDQFGGEYLFDKYEVKLLANRGSTIPVSLEYGKNITDLQQEENIASTYTAVIAYWKSQATTGNVVTVYGDLVKSSNADNFPYIRTYVLDVSSEYQTQPTKAQLTARAEKYVKANQIGVPKVSVKVSFVALWQTEEYKDVAPLQHIHLCDTIKVKFPKLGVNASAKVTKATYDVLNERYDSLEIGDSRSTLASTVSNQASAIALNKKQQSELMWNATQRATEILRGGLGGYVVIRPDESTGYPEEILIMDQPDKDTASNVIRMNKNGIGFSLGNGYDGPFESAWTIDGTFNADFINSGTINADLIKAGTIADKGSNISWNLETGALTAKKLSVNSTNFTLDENGNITANNAALTGASVSGKITSTNATSKDVVEINDGCITGTDGTTGNTVKLEIGDGLFNIVGELALNGNVGVSGETSFVKTIGYEKKGSSHTTVTVGAPTSHTVLKTASLTSGSGTAYASGLSTSVSGNVGTYSGTCSVYITGAGYGTGTCSVPIGTISLSGSTAGNVPTVTYTISTTNDTFSIPSVSQGLEWEEEQAIAGSTGKIVSKYGIIQEIT